MKRILLAALLVQSYTYAQPGVEWKKTYGGSKTDVANDIQVMPDKGYILAGYTDSPDGDVTGLKKLQDFWVVKLDAAGKIEWQKCLGGKIADRAHKIIPVKGGGYLVAGITSSFDMDVSGNHNKDGKTDCWVVKLSDRKS